VEHVDDEAIRSLLTRLGRTDRSGGTVIERAAILAEGADFDAVMTWIVSHGGEPEVRAAKKTSSGLHGSRVQDSSGTDSRPPSRFVLPAGALR
jgi:hypothetical protein